MSCHPLRRRILLTAASLVACATAGGCQESKKAEPPKATPVVLVSTPVEGEITDYEDFTGRTDAVNSVEVRARVTGYLNRTNFKDGSEVKQGDLLFEIDPRPYQADLAQAEAVLAQADAKAKRAETEYRRSVALYNRSAMTREELDLDQDTAAESGRGVDAQRATRDLAKLNLDFTRVTAPITGRISRQHGRSGQHGQGRRDAADDDRVARPDLRLLRRRRADAAADPPADPGGEDEVGPRGHRCRSSCGPGRRGGLSRTRARSTSSTTAWTR